jgi:hypothetical protein
MAILSDTKKRRPKQDLGLNISHKNENEDMNVDKRFEKVFSDPRFRKLPANRTKITIDKRFKSMFTDKKFSFSSKSSYYGS